MDAALPEAGFGWINYATIAVYLFAMFGIGVYCTRMNRNTDDYFRGGQGVPWIAVGISIFATMLSSLTYMAMPAKGFHANWATLLVNVPILLIAPFIAGYILPVFRRMDATSAYEYLEKRFNYALRIFGAVSFTFLHSGRIAIVLLLPSIALSTVAGMNLYVCIGIMAVFSIVYAVMGGMLAVVWTDVIQTIVLLGGAFISLYLLIRGIDGGWATFFQEGFAAGKFSLILPDDGACAWSQFAPAAIAIVLIGSIFNQTVPLTSDQAYIQRYMSTETQKKAARAIWLNAWMAIPAGILFLSLGTGMYVFYSQPAHALPQLSMPDAIFPYFIAHELPAGVAGLVVAGIFAAAQSTVAASLNSISSVLTVDIYKRLFPRRNPDRDLFAARAFSLLVGAVALALTYALAVKGSSSLFDDYLALLALTGSVLAGVFLLGIFSTRANGFGAICGAVLGTATLVYVKTRTGLTFYLYPVVGIGVCVLAGYLASLLRPAPARTLRNLTYFTMNRLSD